MYVHEQFTKVFKLGENVFAQYCAMTMIRYSVFCRCALQSTHLNIRTDPSLRWRPNEPHWLRNHGVDQRNLAIKWLREHHNDETTGVVYFGDGDNTYDLQLFEEVCTVIVCRFVFIV